MANEFVSNEHTEVLQKLIQEVVNDPKTYLGSKYLPSVSLPVRKIRTEVIEATGGLTNEHVVGTAPEYVQSFGTRVQEYEAPAYKEAIHYDEKKILYLRELGQNDRSKRGVRQYIDLDVDRLNRRLEARIEKSRWDAIFTGGFTYAGKTFSYGFNTSNNVVPVGANWSLDGVSANAAADPLKDIRTWIMGGNAQYRKYKIKKMVMNPNTARWILDNANTKSFVQQYFASDYFGAYELNKTLQLLIPGCPEVMIYDGWYQTESVTASKITVSNAVYFVPDGKVFFEASLPGGDMIGEFVQGLHLASGSVDSPGVGKFLVVEDNIAPGTKGGPGNPYMDIISGVYGGVKMDRPFDVLTATVY